MEDSQEMKGNCCSRQRGEHMQGHRDVKGVGPFWKQSDHDLGEKLEVGH